MEARPSQILEFFNGTKQMIIPLFQRPYEWGVKEWETLWEDFVEQYECSNEPIASHFTGAIVTAPARSTPIGVSKYLVIDGQQRLTTISIFICAIKSLLDQNSTKSRKMQSLLVNEYDDGLDYYKLLPTQPDRNAFFELVDSGSAPQESKFSQAFNFFVSKLKGRDSNDDYFDLDMVLQTLQQRLTVVAIHLGENDDPYLIFESLNAKGTPLTQADLVRNYLLLRVHANDQQRIYEQYWLPMQAALPGEHLTEFMRQYLMMRGEKVAKSAVYGVLKQRLLSESPEKVAEELRHMRELSAVYSHIVGISAHPQQNIDASLARLRRWEVATANSFLMKLLELRVSEKIKTDDVVKCISMIESFVVRRAFCGAPTNQLQNLFLVLVKNMPDTDILEWLQKSLKAFAGGRRWPNNDEFKEAFFKYKAYTQHRDRCKFILECLEESFEHKERVSFDDITIEHIMPQTLTDSWKRELGDDFEVVYEKYLHTLGNLTLTGYNPELSNFPFEIKKEILRESKFTISRLVSDSEIWNGKSIINRAETLFEKAMTIWQYN